MFYFFRQGIQFVKENPSIFYSFLLILILPLALYLNTTFTVRAFQENIDLTLQSSALLAETILGIFSSEVVSEPEKLQNKIVQVSKENPEINQLKVIIPENEKFKIVASKNLEELNLKIQGDPLALSWSRNQAIAYLTADEKQERFWEVIKPIQDQEGNKSGLIIMTLSLKTADDLMKKTIYRSYLITLIAILLTLFLIIHHTRLFKYPVLLRRLQEIDKMKDDFIRMATHELQSPIINIRGYILSLKEEIETFLNEEQKKYFFRIETSAKNLANLIEDILEVSRIEQGRLDFSPQKVQPQEIIKEVIEELQIKAKEKNLTLLFEERPEDFYIQVNSNRFRQILFNLIDNGIKYTFQGGIEVTASSDLTQRKYFISISDTGLGIPAPAQKRLFEKFYRVKTKETADIPGTGLGLWISKQLTEKMGGEIFIESLEGTGTRFTIVFPLVKS